MSTEGKRNIVGWFAEPGQEPRVFYGELFGPTTEFPSLADHALSPFLVGRHLFSWWSEFRSALTRRPARALCGVTAASEPTAMSWRGEELICTECILEGEWT